MKKKVCRTGTNSVKRNVPLALLLLFANVPASAEDHSLGFDRYKAAHRAIQLTLSDVHKKHVDNWLLVAMLGKCKNEGLAKAVAGKLPPLKDEIHNALLGALQKDKSLSILTADQLDVTHAAVAETIAGYRHGLSSGLAFAFTDKGAEEVLCSTAVMKADEYLAR